MGAIDKGEFLEHAEVTRGGGVIWCDLACYCVCRGVCLH